MNLAWQIEKIEFHNSKQKHHNSWLKQAADALEIDLDDDLLMGNSTKCLATVFFCLFVSLVFVLSSNEKNTESGTFVSRKRQG